VMATSPIVYVADMFTADAARGRGFGRAILYRLHAAAAARGATRSVLFPSRMAAESGFYAHAGYEIVCPCAVLLSRPPET
jgi:GNAT superfamily N-acetyltransferase